MKNENCGNYSCKEQFVQYAWLENDKGYWCLFSEKLKKENRKWSNEDLALKELQEEGWIVAVLYLMKHRKKFRAYGLSRLVH